MKEKPNDLWNASQYKTLCFHLEKLTKLGLNLLIATSNDKEAVEWAKSCMIGLEEGFPSLGEDGNDKN